jgi:hypothetical protein
MYSNNDPVIDEVTGDETRSCDGIIMRVKVRNEITLLVLLKCNIKPIKQ